MEDLEFNQEKFQTIRTLFSEISEMRNQLNEKYKTKVELDNELSLRKRIEEESRAVKASLEEQLANSKAEKELLSEELERAVEKQKRIEELLAKRESEMEVMTNNLQSERQTLKQAVPPEEDFWKVYNLATGQDRVMLLAFLHLAARRGEGRFSD